MDITIIGAGVIGLSIARELGSCADHVVIMEKEPRPGMGISSRNSEVIHSGIYYPTGSLKARFCVEGSVMLSEYCTSHKVPYQNPGKVIVATEPSEEKTVEKLFLKGTDNCVQGLKILTRSELKKIEPNVSGICALHSHHTGIIDSHRLIKSLEAQCLDKGVSIFYNTEITALQNSSAGFVCTACSLNGNPYTFSSRVVINATGLFSDKIAALAGIDIDAAGYRIYPVKGEYFRVRGGKHKLVGGLVYPVPERNLKGLGIHATKDLEGFLRLGPNAFPVDDITYDVDSSHANIFYESARGMLPFLDPSDLVPDMAGIRPKIQKPGGSQKDFMICHEEAHGLAGLFTLAGIESPGLTSCLSIGRYVAALVKKAGLIS